MAEIRVWGPSSSRDRRPTSGPCVCVSASSASRRGARRENVAGDPAGPHAATPRLGTDCADDPASLASQAENLVAAGTPIPEDLAEARDSVRRARLASPSLALALRG